MSEINIPKLRRRILVWLFLVIGFYTISQTAYLWQVSYVHHSYWGYTGTSVPYHWYLFHSHMRDMLYTLLPILILLVGVITPENIIYKIIMMFVVGIIVFWVAIFGTAGFSSYPIYTMHHQGSTRYKDHLYHLASFGSSDPVYYRDKGEIEILYQCDSFGLICSSEFSITDDDRKEILERIQ